MCGVVGGRIDEGVHGRVGVARMATEVAVIHVYSEQEQPATGWVDTHSDQPIEMWFAPDSLIRTNCCEETRPARECVVQSYYDGASIWCAEGKGCKDPEVIAAQAAAAFERRSRAQRARRAREREAKDTAVG